VNHLTAREFVGLFAEAGLAETARTPLNTADGFEQILFEFRRTPGVKA
jgi:hypothetical protein